MLLKASPVGEVAPLGDGEGEKISNFIVFSDSRGRLSLQVCANISVKRTKYPNSIVGVGALDDPKTIDYCNILGEPAMCAKNLSV